MPSQVFIFAPARKAGTVATIASTVSAVPLDGSAAVVVGFPAPFAAAVQSVTVQFTPSAETDYQVATEVFSVTVNGFTLVAHGGPVGATGNFTYTAVGL